MGFDAVVSALEERDLIRPSWGENITALCPAHDDNNPSLSVKEGDDGRALVFDHAGCEPQAIVEALGLQMSDLFSSDKLGTLHDSYTYRDADGNPLYRVLRYLPKTFRQERWDGERFVPGLEDTERVPYRLPELLASGVSETVYLVEGEKDAEALASRGLIATTLPMGAGKWRDEYGQWFKGRHVAVVGDADDVGRDHATTVAARLADIATTVQVRYPALGSDVSDHLNAGLELDELVVEDGGLSEFGPLDWEAYSTPDVEWLLKPYVPRGARVLAYGPKGSLKSLWAMWLASHVAKDGGRVAYFSLEMLPSDTARRLKQLQPPKDRFLVFTKDFKLGSPSHTEKLIAGLKGFDLIVIDSWSAARAGAKDSNQEVAQLDNDVFLPLIRLTGATVLLIDNTGHDAVTDKGKVLADHARGASAKGDKMEVELWFRRPKEELNYRTEIKVKKMRIDHQWPPPLVVETPQDRIEFYEVDTASGVMTNTPAWPGLLVNVSTDGNLPSAPTAPAESEATEPAPATEMTPAERRAMARLTDMFGSKADVS